MREFGILAGIALLIIGVFGQPYLYSEGSCVMASRNDKTSTDEGVYVKYRDGTYWVNFEGRVHGLSTMNYSITSCE